MFRCHAPTYRWSIAPVRNSCCCTTVVLHAVVHPAPSSKGVHCSIPAPGSTSICRSSSSSADASALYSNSRRNSDVKCTTYILCHVPDSRIIMLHVSIVCSFLVDDDSNSSGPLQEQECPGFAPHQTPKTRHIVHTWYYVPGILVTSAGTHIL